MHIGFEHLFLFVDDPTRDVVSLAIGDAWPREQDRPTTRKDIVALERSVDSITAFAEHIRAGDHAAVAESPLTQKAMRRRR